MMWILLLPIIAIAGMALGVRLFPNFADKGYGICKTLSVLIFGYVIWLSNFMFAHRNVSGILLALFLIFVIAAALINFHLIKRLSKETIRVMITEELLFVILFVLMCIFRSANPRIEGIEKFMDYGILNGIDRGVKLPPEDIWFSGNSINYYYFGHFVLAILNKLTFTPLATGYNLLVAFLFAATGTGIFSICYNLTKRYSYGFLGTILLVGAGNLDYLAAKYLEHRVNFFYADARSLIPNTINEFPLYSFLISDLHAHIINLPFVLLAIAFISYLYFFKPVNDKLFFVTFILSFGALGAINTWDMLVYAGLLAAVVFKLNFKKEADWKKSVIQMTIMLSIYLIPAIVLYLPYYLHFHPAVSGVKLFFPKIHLIPTMKMFGLFLAVVLPYLVITRWKLTYTRILCIFGIVLALVPGFLLVKDIYFTLNPPFSSANTYFKIWYQAWVVFCIAVPLCLYELFKNKIKYSNYLAILWGILLFTCIQYTFHSVRYIVGPIYKNNGLDGTNYLEPANIDEKYTIEWINKNIKGQPVLLEMYGESYTLDSLVASYTGLPTLVGWSSHELGWRNDWPAIANRQGEIELLYSKGDINLVRNLVKKYNIEYVLISNKERSKLGDEAGSILRTLTTKVYRNNSVELLKIDNSKL